MLLVTDQLGDVDTSEVQSIRSDEGEWSMRGEVQASVVSVRGIE